MPSKPKVPKHELWLWYFFVLCYSGLMSAFIGGAWYRIVGEGTLGYFVGIGMSALYLSSTYDTHNTVYVRRDEDV